MDSPIVTFKVDKFDKALTIEVTQNGLGCKVILKDPCFMSFDKWQLFLSPDKTDEESFYFLDYQAYVVTRTKGSNIAFSVSKWGDGGGSVEVTLPKVLIRDKLLETIKPLYDTI